jgi:hypothetical protein
VIEGPRSERTRAAEAGGSAATLRDWAKETAERAQLKARSSPIPGRRGNREKELFALRAQHVKTLFRVIEGMVAAVNKEAGTPLLVAEKTFNPKNLGGIEVPDGARLVIKFLERRLEVVVGPLVNIGGRPVPVGALASASVIQYDPADPAGTDWYDLVLREDGGWQRKPSEGEPASPPFGERDYRGLVEWLVG